MLPCEARTAGSAAPAYRVAAIIATNSQSCRLTRKQRSTSTWGRLLRRVVHPAPAASIGPGTCVLNPLTRRLVVGAYTIFRECAGLFVHLDGALPLIFERGDQLVLVDAPQHAHVPGPVEKHRPQILGAGLLVQRILRRKATIIPRCCLIVGVTGGDLDH